MPNTDNSITLDPERIVFGEIFSPYYCSIAYKDGEWSKLKVLPLQDIALHPAALVLHYGQAIFEGLKAFKQQDGHVALFRPLMNARRLNMSAERLAMPMLHESVFLNAAAKLVERNAAYLPAFPGSMYLRPTMIATEPCIGVRSAKEYLFFILALPVGRYFPGVKGAGAIDVFVTESVIRAVPGGTGSVKAAPNYAGTLQVTTTAKDLGCSQVLFLDSSPAHRVQEMGGMNIFFVDDGELITPPLDGSILPGVTRDCIIQLARAMRIPVREQAYSLDEMISGLERGRIMEVFASGTAAVITGIRKLHFERGLELHPGEGSPGTITTRLFERLQAIQHGSENDQYDWLTRVPLHSADGA